MNKRIENKLMGALNRGRAYSIKSGQEQNKIFETLKSIGIDDSGIVSSDAPNADNLEDAITSYVNYGEYTPEEIIEEIKNSLN